jgi:hypothetical protein
MLNDFALCKNNKCPSAMLCLRFLTRREDDRQVYALFQPDETGKCEYFIEEIDEPSISVWKVNKYQGKYKHVKTSSEEFAKNKEV